MFFDLGRAELTSEARRVVAEAAESYRQTGQARVDVTGYTDTSGSPELNQRLSERRAQAVEVELVRQGVPASSITVSGRGQTDLLVPTADGVRKPENRRVEIAVAQPEPAPVAVAQSRSSHRRPRRSRSRTASCSRWARSTATISARTTARAATRPRATWSAPS